MANDVKYRIGVGKLNDDIGAADGVILLPPFTADSTLIFANTTLRFADETNL